MKTYYHLPEELAAKNLAGDLNELTEVIHNRNVEKGWFTNILTGEPLNRNIPEMLCLIHSEISEAMEGFRKDLMDDHLPHRKMEEVELADAIIRILDLAGYRDFDIGGAVAEKMAYNAVRKDHTVEARLRENGKKI